MSNEFITNKQLVDKIEELRLVVYKRNNYELRIAIDRLTEEVMGRILKTADGIPYNYDTSINRRTPLIFLRQGDISPVRARPFSRREVQFGYSTIEALQKALQNEQRRPRT